MRAFRAFFRLIWFMIFIGLICLGSYGAYKLLGSDNFKFLALFKLVLLALLVLSGLAIAAGTIIAVVAISKIFGKGGFIDGKILNFFPMRFHAKKTVAIKPKKYPFSYFNAKLASGDLKLEAATAKTASGSIQVRCEDVNDDIEVFFEGGSLAARTKDGRDVYISDINIKLPSNVTTISAATAHGDIELSGFTGLKSVTGKTANGDLQLNELNKAIFVELRNVSGDITVRDSSIDQLDTVTISGDIELKDSKVNTFSAKAISGDIDFSTSTVKSKHIKAVSGRVID